MITLTREEAQQVLDAFAWELGGEPIGTEIQKSVDLLRARLAQPELEPELKLISTGVTHIYSTGASVAQPEPEEDGDCQNCDGSGCVACDARFLTPQREWQGLTDEDLSVCDEDGVILARYWEAKLKEKNA